MPAEESAFCAFRVTPRPQGEPRYTLADDSLLTTGDRHFTSFALANVMMKSGAPPA